MPLSVDDARDVVKDLLKVRDAELARLDKIRGYMRGEVCQIYSPRKTTAEYRQIVEMSKVNVLPLVVSAFAQNLFVEGYRGRRAKNNVKAWDVWQDNRMDQRQALIYRAALAYGLAYTTTFRKRGGGAIITPYSPRELTAVYDDPINDEWPVYAVTCSDGYDKAKKKRVHRIELLDSEWRYRFVRVHGDTELYYVAQPDDDSEETPSGAHGLPECPVVRWVNAGQDLDEGPVSEVEPLFPLQDQINNTTYALLIKQQFQAFRQRWVTGMTIEENPDGSEREPFRPGVDRVFHGESPDTKFGEFEEGSLQGLLDSRQSTLSLIAVTAQISPTALVLSDGTIANLSADALAALESSQQRKQAGMKTSFGESNEQQLRLGCAAAGIDGYDDRSSQVVWRDTESRSLGQAADAANKLSAVGIPPRALWDLLLDWLPNLSQQDLERWEAYAAQEDGLAEKAQQPPQPPMEPMMQQGGMTDVVPAGAARPAGPARSGRRFVGAGTP